MDGASIEFKISVSVIIFVRFVFWPSLCSGMLQAVCVMLSSAVSVLVCVAKLI